MLVSIYRYDPEQDEAPHMQDFSIEVEKVEDPKGDRVQIIMCGKFLPYKKW